MDMKKQVFVGGYVKDESFATVDLSQIEYRMARSFQEDALRRTIDKIQAGELDTKTLPFTKSRAIRMAKALTYPAIGSNHGNLNVTFDGDRFLFAYRGTPILEWKLTEMTGSDIAAPQYEGKESTIYQRTAARDAIHEFRQLAIAEGLK